MITKVRTRRRKFQLSEMNSELREMKFGLREMNFELREMNFGLRELKFGLREINLSCEVLDSQSHRTLCFSFYFSLFLPLSLSLFSRSPPPLGACSAFLS